MAEDVPTTDLAPKPAPIVAVPPVEAAIDPSIPGELLLAAQKAKAHIQGLDAGLRASQQRTQQILNDVLDNEAEALKNKGGDAEVPLLDANRLFQVYGPERTAIIQGRRSANKLFFDATNGWRSDAVDFEKMQSDLAKLDPHKQDALSPSFKTYVDNYKEAEALLHKLMADHDKELQRQGDDALKKFMVAPQGTVTREQVNSKADHMTTTQLKAAQALADPFNNVVNDPAVAMSIEHAIREMPPADFERFLIPLIAGHYVGDPSKLIERNETMQSKGLDSPFVAAKKDLEGKLSPGGLAGPAGNDQRGVLADAINEMNTWARDNPKLINDPVSVENKRFEIYKRARDVLDQKLGQNTTRSVYFPPSFNPGNKNNITPELIAKAKESFRTDMESGRIGVSEAAQRWNNLKEWEAKIPGIDEQPLPRSRPTAAPRRATNPSAAEAVVNSSGTSELK